MTKQDFIARAAPEIEAWFRSRYAGYIDSTRFSFDPADARDLASELWNMGHSDREAGFTEWMAGQYRARFSDHAHGVVMPDGTVSSGGLTCSPVEGPLAP